jgi:hypothetical protein
MEAVSGHEEAEKIVVIVDCGATMVAGSTPFAAEATGFRTGRFNGGDSTTVLTLPFADSSSSRFGFLAVDAGD